EPPQATGLNPITSGVAPISAEEHLARLAKLQSLMQRRSIAAFLVEAGSTLEYFTGVRWWRSERTTAALVPAEGRVVVVTPFFEEPSIRETLRIPGDLRPWKEDESPFELLAGALRERAAAKGTLAVAAHTALGGTHEFALVLLNEASAFPHGSIKPQSVHEGSVILIDAGCSVHGYQSDISRSWVAGTPSPRQRELWDTVKRGQELAL